MFTNSQWKPDGNRIQSKRGGSKLIVLEAVTIVGQIICSAEVGDRFQRLHMDDLDSLSIDFQNPILAQFTE